MNAAIKVEMKFHVRDTCHNPFGENIREVQGFQQGLKKIPVDGVKGFSYTNFQHALRGDVLSEVAPS